MDKIITIDGNDCDAIRAALKEAKAETTEEPEEEKVVFKDTHENLYAKQSCKAILHQRPIWG